MSKFEKKFGKYAIPNLTVILIGCYAIGYCMQYVNYQFLSYLTLDIHKILTQGQVWRILSWIIVPPESFDVFTVIMLWFYYSIGTSMERTIGTYKYNVYIFRGIVFTVLSAFLCYGFLLITEGNAEAVETLFAFYAPAFSTYYINLSIFLAFAILYPNRLVFFMFVIPVKIKLLAILDLILIGFLFLDGYLFSRFAIGASLINVLIFFLMMRNVSHLMPSQIKRRAQFQHRIKKVKKVTKHKCAICGQTDEDDPSLEFRFCSKCKGNYEYCNNHLYTHEHVK